MVTEERKEEILQLEDEPSVYQKRMIQLQHLRKNRTFCDVVLQVGTSEIFAHRSILACASPFFMELFTTDDENRSGSEEKIIYKLNGGFERESLETLVTYIYTGKLEAPLYMLKSVFIAANKLKMENITNACGERLVANLTPETCLTVRTLPRIGENLDLVEQVDLYIQQQGNLMQVTQDSVNVPKILLKVMHTSRDEAGMTTRALCSLAFDWVKEQLLEKEYNVQMLTEKEHLLYLSFDNSLHDCLDIKAGAVNDSEMVQDYKKISRKISSIGIKIRRKSQTTQPIKPRMMLFSRSISDQDDVDDYKVDWKLIAFSKASENSSIAIVTFGGCVTILSIQQHVSTPVQNSPTEFSPRPRSVEKEVDSYTLIPHMSTSRCACGTGTFEGKLLVCGGYDREECLKEVELYDPSTNTWVNLPHMQQCRGRFDVTVVDGKVYAVGGCTGSKELPSVEVFDHESNCWSYVAPLPFSRSNSGVCALNGEIFCVGGWNGKTGMKRCEVYCPKTDIWRTASPMNLGRYQAAVISFKDKVYVVGGCDSWNCLSSMEVYDTEDDTWTHVSPMNTPRRGCGAAVLDGKIYVMGGSDGTHILCSTEIYDPELNTWSTGTPMTSCRANVNASVIDNKIYAVGGFSGKCFLNSIEFLDPSSQEWTNFTPKPDYLMKKSDCKRTNDYYIGNIRPAVTPV